MQENTMLRHLVWILCLLVTHPALAAKAPPLQQQYALDQVAPDVFVVHGPTEAPNPANQGFMNNPSFVITSAGVVVVDPGSSVQTGEMLMAHIEKTTSKPVVAILITHAHGDHWLGNQAIVAKYPLVKIYAHPHMAKLVEQGEGETWIDFMSRLTEGATNGTRAVGPTHRMSDGDILSFGDLSFEVIEQGRAHTTTDIMLYVKQRALIFLADNANQNFIVPVEGSFQGNIRALDRAINSGAKIFIPGHGKTADVSIARSYRDFLTTIYTTTKAGYDDGKADFEIRPELLPRLERWKDWSGFEGQLGQLINFAYLEAEAESFK